MMTKNLSNDERKGSKKNHIINIAGDILHPQSREIYVALETMAVR